MAPTCGPALKRQTLQAADSLSHTRSDSAFWSSSGRTSSSIGTPRGLAPVMRCAQEIDAQTAPEPSDLLTFLRPDLGEVFQERLAEYCAATNRAAIRVARDTRWPHPAIHMFGWLKSH